MIYLNYTKSYILAIFGALLFIANKCNDKALLCVPAEFEVIAELKIPKGRDYLLFEEDLEEGVPIHFYVEVKNPHQHIAEGIFLFYETKDDVELLLDGYCFKSGEKICEPQAVMSKDKKWSLRISSPGTKKIKLIVHDQGLARKEKDFTLVVKTRQEVDTERGSLSEIIQEGKGNTLKRVRDVLASQNDAQARFTMVHGTAKDDIAPLVAALNLEAEQSKALVTIFLENGLHPDSPVIDGRKLLEYAFEKEDEALMGILLAKGADPHVTKADGPSPKSLFDWTIEENKLNLVKQLIQTGKVKPSCEAVYKAAQKGHKELLEYFKDYGFIDVTDENQNSALARAVNQREKQTFEVLLQQGADPTIEDQEGKRVLTKAINKKSIEFLDDILDRQALVAIFQPDSPASDGQKLLEYALEKEDEVLIGMLLAKGADPHVSKVDGPSTQSLFDWAVEENKLNLVKQLIQTGKVKPSCEAVYKAAQKGYKELLEYFKDYGFIDVTDKNQNSALTRAVNQREKQTFEVLLQQGADPKLEDQEGKRVLTKAINKKSIEFLDDILDHHSLVDIFLENGADSLVSNGRKLLEYAFEKEDEVLIGMLLTKGADPRVTKVDGPSAQSLFDWAFQENKLNLVKQLMETGKVKPSCEDIYKAAQKGYKELLEHFKHQGFIDITDENQNTALTRAMNQREKQTFEVLLQQGADPKLEDQKGKRVLTKAIDYKKLEFLAGILDRHALVEIFQPDSSVSGGKKLLEYALEKEDETLIGMLLAKGADPHVTKADSPSSKSFFDWAVENNKPNLVKQLIHTGKVNPSTDAVYKAAQKGHKEMLEHFKHHGCIDVRDKNQNSALARAVNQREKQTFEVLLQQGADPTIEDQEGKRVLTKAINKKQLEFLAGILDHHSLVDIFLENSTDSLVSNGRKLLEYAFEKEDEVLIGMLLAKGADPRVTKAEGLKSLFDWAVEENKLSLAKQLIHTGKVKPSCEAIYQTAQKGNKEMLEHFKKHGCIDVTDENQNSALVRALNDKDKQTFEVLLQQGADPKLEDQKGKRVLTKAINHKQLEFLAGILDRQALVALFLENGPDSLVSNGQKLLEYALEKEDEALIGMLLAKGADPHVTKADSPSSKSFFDWAVEENKLSLVKQLIQTGKVNPSCEAIYQTAQKGNKEMLEHFKKHGFIDVTDENQNTALARAVNEREKQTFEVLLQQGADPTIEDQEGKRVLTKAINKKQLEFLAGILDHHSLVDIFLENGTDSLVSDGQKLLEYAFEKEDEALMGMLLAKGADPRVTKADSPSSKSLFDWAVEENKPNLVKQLLETGKVKPSCEAIYQTAQKGHKEMLEHFKKHGFIDVRDKNQNSALAKAVNDREKQTFEVLLQQGADPSIEDQKGKRVLTKAINKKSLEFLAGILDRQALVAIFQYASPVSDGQKLLEYAFEKEDETLIGMLLAKGADPHVTKAEGLKSLFDWAVEENKLNLVKQLIQTGKVNPSCEAIYQTAQKGNKEMLEHFKHHGFIDVRDKNQNSALARAVNQREKQTFEVLLQQGADPTIKDQEGKRVLTKAINKKSLEFLAGILDHHSLVDIFLENGPDSPASDGQKLLEYAFEKEDETLIGILLAKGTDPHVTKVEGLSTKSLFDWAVEENKLNLVKQLLETGTVQCNGGKIVDIICTAVRQNNHGLLSVLVDTKLINKKDPQGETALIRMIKVREKAHVNELLQAGAAIEVEDDEGRTPLLVAAKLGDIDMFQFLLHERGASKHVKDHAGYDALGVAVLAGKVKMVKYLVEEKGFDIYQRDPNRRPLMYHAASLGQENIMEVLQNAHFKKLGLNYKMSNMDYDTCLKHGLGNAYKSKVKNGKERVTAEIRKGFYLASYARLGNFEESALHVAARNNDLNATRLLLKFGALDHQNSQGERAMDIALLNGGDEITALLLHRENIMKNCLRYTYVSNGYICVDDRPFTKTDLVEGDLINAETDFILEINDCLEKNHIERADFLGGISMDFNGVDRYGRIPLFMVIKLTRKEERRKWVQLFLYGDKNDKNFKEFKGANPNHRYQSHTPLHEAVKQNDEVVIGMLIDAGAHVDALDEQGRTPMALADELGHVAAMQGLLNKRVKMSPEKKSKFYSK